MIGIVLLLGALVIMVWKFSYTWEDLITSPVTYILVAVFGILDSLGYRYWGNADKLADYRKVDINEESLLEE